MRPKAPALLPIFRSDRQLEILGALYVRGEEPTPSELARRLGVHQTTVAREIQRLAEAGVVTIRTVGRASVVSANWAAPWAQDLARLLDKTIGPVALLREALSGVEGIESAFVFGSWAARHHGVVGPPPRDIDVVVIGEASAISVGSACAKVSRRVGVDVNPTVVTRDAWLDPPEGSVLAQIRSGPLTEVIPGSG